PDQGAFPARHAAGFRAVVRPVGSVILREQNEADESQNESASDRRRREIGGNGAGLVATQHPIQRLPCSTRLPMGPQGRAHCLAEQDEQKRRDRQQRGQDIQVARVLLEVEELGHAYPFNSSAVSTSTVMWLL